MSKTFRLFNGELIQIGADVPEKQWSNLIAEELGVNPYQVVITENNIFVHPTPTLTLKNGVHFLPSSSISFATTLVEHAMEQSMHAKNKFSSVWQLPHELVVQRAQEITQKMKDIPDTILEDLLVNPHDEVVDLILANPPRHINYLSRLSHNSNPRAHAHIISRYQQSNPGGNVRLVVHNYMYLTYNWLAIFNTADRQSLEWIFRLFERSGVLHQLFYNDEVGDLFAPYILSGEFDVQSALGTTTHPAIIQYILEKVSVEKENDGQTFMLAFNPHHTIVDHFIQHPQLLNTNKRAFNMNPGDKAVEWLIDHPELIEWDAFATNRNTRAMEACRHRDDIPWDASFQSMCDAIVEERTPLLPLEDWWQVLMRFRVEFVNTEFRLK